ncbi:MAG: glycosyltransferase family 39 protein [Polyangiaceae bacterium]|nr:glycosyltransferase family 39 protein [Polyangiaceae bacterium]
MLSFLKRNVIVLICLAVTIVYAVVADRLRLSKDVGAAVFAPMWLLVAGHLLRRLKFYWGTVAIVLGGLVLYFLYLGYTSPGERNYDGPEQLDKYIGYIVKNHTIPPAKQCFICHHPPFYYVLGALAQVFFNFTKLAPHPAGVQIFSLAIFFAFIVYSLLLARLFAEKKALIRIVAALIVFWPYSIHNSVRIHNDTLVTALVAAGMYYAARWYKEDKPRYLYASGLCAALGILTKSSAFALVAILGLMLAWRFFTRRGRVRLLKRGVLTMAMVAAAYGGLKLRAPVAEDPCHKTFGTACDIRKSDFTGNHPKNYLTVDFKKLLADPYMCIHNDDAGKQYFWIHVLKSSLFGTHNKIPDRETAYSLNRKVGFVMNIVLFAMIVYALIAALSGVWRGYKKFAVPFMFAAVSALFLMAFKIAIPAPHHTDFRHIYFAMAPGAVLFAAAVLHLHSRHAIFGALGKLLFVSFSAMSIFYFIPKYDIVMAYTRETVNVPLASVKRPVPEWTPWDRDGNTLIEGNQTIALIAESPIALVSNVDTTVDGNDVYEIKIFGKGAPRTLVVRPKKDLKVGVAHHVLKVEPPVENVTRITVRPLSGDRTYSIGHLIAN